MFSRCHPRIGGVMGATALVLSFLVLPLAAQLPNGAAAGDPALPKPPILWPHLTLTLLDNGVTTRQTTQVPMADIGVAWMQGLKDASVRKELEVVDEQWSELQHWLKTNNRDGKKLREGVEAILLPHQIDQLGRIIERYRCLVTGIHAQLGTSPVFADAPLSEAERAQVKDRLDAVAKRYRERTARELKFFDAEIRRELTSAQLALVKKVNGERRICEAELLDATIAQLSTLVADGTYVDLNEDSVLLGRSQIYVVQVSGQVTVASNNTPLAFFANATQLFSAANLHLDIDQREVLRAHQTELTNELSKRSKEVYQTIERGEIGLDEAKTTLTMFANVQALRSVGIFDKVLTPDQMARLRQFAHQRDLVQRGLFASLIEGPVCNQLRITEDQKRKLSGLAGKRLPEYRKIAREVEGEIWRTVGPCLSAERRHRWEKHFGADSFVELTACPYLLLYCEPPAYNP